MAESMDDYKKEIDASFSRLRDGNIMSGKVENEEEAENNIAWQHMKEMQTSGEEFDVKVGGMVNGGLIAYVENIRAFIPASQISMEFVENLEEYLGKNLHVRVITVDENRKKLVLSAKVILKEKADAERQKKQQAYHVGDIVSGKVGTIMPYGAFIDLQDGVSGLVHVSQICEKRIKHPGVVLKEGEEVKAKVIDIKDGKISLSIKALAESPDGGENEEVTEHVELPETEELTTNLGSLFKDIKL